MRFIIPLILIGIAITSFFMFTKPLYNDISTIKSQIASYNQALDNSKALENQRDQLTTKEDSFSRVDLEKLKTLLPNNVDNIRLILEIEKVAKPYGMVLKDVKYDAQTKKAATGTEATPNTFPGAAAATNSNSNYGTWSLSFSTEGTYNNFVNFLKDLEKNLRIVDVASVDFSSDSGVGASPALSNIYKYAFKIQTYWLKN